MTNDKKTSADFFYLYSVQAKSLNGCQATWRRRHKTPKSSTEWAARLSAANPPAASHSWWSGGLHAPYYHKYKPSDWLAFKETWRPTVLTLPNTYLQRLVQTSHIKPYPCEEGQNCRFMPTSNACDPGLRLEQPIEKSVRIHPCEV